MTYIHLSFTFSRKAIKGNKGLDKKGGVKINPKKRFKQEIINRKNSAFRDDGGGMGGYILEVLFCGVAKLLLF